MTNWNDDLMNRKAIGDFLYQLILQKYESTRNKGSICLTLDGNWGEGKTFFINRWTKDLRDNHHPVIHFDAWRNDLTDDPLIGFLSAIREAINGQIKNLPAIDKVENIQKAAKSFFKRAGKALVPASVEIGKGILAKTIGRETVEALNEIIHQPKEDSDDSSQEISDKAFDVFFEKTLHAHTQKREAIDALVLDLEALAKALESSGVLKLPIFICVDELDRCKPTYAIALLEGVKHLLDAKGVCFVYSTNMTQLSESIKAVYGNGFNGFMYLKRFFDFEYRLPPADTQSYTNNLLKSSIIQSRRLISCIPDNANEHSVKKLSPHIAISEIADIFQLDLRSQSQVFSIFESAAIVINAHDEIHCDYLYILAALLHKSPTEFKNIAINRNLKIEDYFKNNNLYDISRSYQDLNKEGRLKEYEASYAKIFSIYLSPKATERGVVDAGPISSSRHVAEVLSSCRISNGKYKTDIYPKLIQLAGYIKI